MIGLGGLCCREISIRALDVTGVRAVAVGIVLVAAGLAMGFATMDQIPSNKRQRFRGESALLVLLVALGHVLDDHATGQRRWREAVLSAGAALFLAWEERRLQKVNAVAEVPHGGGDKEERSDI